MKKTAIIKSWTSAFIVLVSIIVASLARSLSDSFGISNLIIPAGIIIAIVGVMFWFFNAWQYDTSDPIHARIMYVNRWSNFKCRYEIKYFLEWQYETTTWFMGFLLERNMSWTQANYVDDLGYDTASDAKLEFFNRIKQLKMKTPVKEIQEIEVFIVQDEIDKCTI